MNGIDGIYTARQVTETTLAATIAEIKALGFTGVNVTYPLKEKVVPRLDSTSRRASLLSAANTLHLSSVGLSGHNTDSIGTALAIEQFGGPALKGSSAVIFGAGGAGRAAALGLLEAGAAEISWLVRDVEKARLATKRLSDGWPGRVCRCLSITGPGASEERADIITNAAILINATPAGMSGVEGEKQLAHLARLIRPDHCCFDLVYHPRQTAWLKAAQEQGATWIEGLCLLVAQASLSFSIWTGIEFDLPEMFLAVTDHLSENEEKRKG